ncbi:serine/threonine protein kinase [Angustibacter peucedani]
MSEHSLLDRTALDDPAADLAGLGRVFRVVDQQDSGCVSYGVQVAGERWFVKTATTEAAGRSLANAARVHAAVRHPAVVAPVRELTARGWPALVYPWVDGEVLYPATVGPDGRATTRPRTHPDSPMRRFRALPVEPVRAAVDVVLDAHRPVDAAGLVAVDLYDGCFLYDWQTATMRLVDLDEYRPGPFVPQQQLPGSNRFYAPEERGTGQVVDRRTTVYRLGRVARLLLDAGDDEQAWRGTAAELAVVARATAADPDERYQDVDALVDAWLGARA